jgi:hypothetical protein
MDPRCLTGGTKPQGNGLSEGRVKRVLVYPVDISAWGFSPRRRTRSTSFLQNEARIEVDGVLPQIPGRPAGCVGPTEKGPLLRSMVGPWRLAA